ncbi:carbohydrate ABC transporter permease [Halalkalibacter hemicellulosilyticus]|uniref:Binding-protein-dependent transport systems inner membrane component n=1 Tax=Halalkalibacter hemicellulosilyticusJCM 9152 TaxID=1236971 RepID=W4QKK3_9BACI|nr:sugar ABC transporter permease [Halalkalibacter hemicellulosilyticus]GAE32173.1 binding-protein-dependent transport systems inner membrane component [Halalkalibacter hemicellulosilyticusJCM 9152]
MKSLAKLSGTLRTYEGQKVFWGVLFVSPWLLGFIFFFFVPLLTSLQFSFSEISASSEGMTVSFVGMTNYIEALTVNTSFNRILIESIMNIVINVPLIVIFSLFLAVILNQNFRGRSLARSIFFLPVILASGVILSLEATSLVQDINQQNATSGGFSNMLSSFELQRMMINSGVNVTIVNYLTGAVDRIYEIVSQSGVQILIFLAAIQTIPPQLYEASKIEGATGYEAFWKITFPMVSPLILVNLIYTIIDSFSRSPVTELIMSTGFDNFNFGLSSAMAWLYFVSIMLILAVSTYFISKKVFYQD